MTDSDKQALEFRIERYSDDFRTYYQVFIREGETLDGMGMSAADFSGEPVTLLCDNRGELVARKWRLAGEDRDLKTALHEAGIHARFLIDAIWND